MISVDGLLVVAPDTVATYSHLAIAVLVHALPRSTSNSTPEAMSSVTNPPNAGRLKVIACGLSRTGTLCKLGYTSWRALARD